MVRFFQAYWFYLEADFFCQAKLAISIARKMNALIFLVPEDIVDVRPRLVRCFCSLLTILLTPSQILTFVGSLMSIA